VIGPAIESTLRPIFARTVVNSGKVALKAKIGDKKSGVSLAKITYRPQHPLHSTTLYGDGLTS